MLTHVRIKSTPMNPAIPSPVTIINRSSVESLGVVVVRRVEVVVSLTEVVGGIVGVVETDESMVISA